MIKRTILLLMLPGLTSPAFADELPTDNSPDLRPTPAVDDDNHPINSTDAHWAAILIAAIAGLFFAAAIIGPIVRAEAPQAVPSAMSHEEDPAADRH